MQDSFIHLDVHTEYSISDGICRIPELLAAVAAQHMPALAMTDKTNLFGAVKFYSAAMKAGVKPLFGAQVYVVTPEQPTLSRLLLLCCNPSGYRQLTELLSRAYTAQGQHHQPVVEFEWLEKNTQGLIAISGGYHSDIGSALLSGLTEKAQQLAAQWQTIFPARFYLMISRIGREQEEQYIQQVVALAAALQVPIVATNEVRFIHAEDFTAHEARVAIHEGYTLEDPKRPHNFTAQQYLRTPEEMQALFADLPEALANTIEIAKRCNVFLELGKNYLPNFPLPPGTTAEDYLLQQAQQGLLQRLKTLPHVTNQEPYTQRLQIELQVINPMGFASYFLIVADFIQWAKHHNIPVGPGRGSGAGSLVAYALGITDLDPLQYDLLFERFLNPERVSLPDFDIDFCMQRRDEVIDYVAQRYGRDKVSQIITFGTLAAKAVVRDVGRVLGYPYGFVDKLAKLIPFEIGMTLEKALLESAQLKERYDQEEEVKELISLALKLEGITRNAGKHAGGVVIAPTALTDFVPLYCEEDGSSLVTQFDKDDVEAIGLVKFDFLGLRTLTIIQWACETINTVPDTHVDITAIPLDDKKTFRLLQKCQTTAVFQLESRGMKDLIKRQQPDCFEDIIALVALFRPGPLQTGMVDDFINCKHGRAQASYLHPSLEPILRPTYGVILYQEQVMQIAQVLAGYTLGSADLLRRAMGKKKPEEMAQQREIFVSGAVARGVDKNLASNIFDLMEKFAGYGFNKSHSAAYALLAYQTGWLKAHYPAAFMAAVLSADMDNTDKVVIFIEDCHNLKVNVLPPDVNESEYRFTIRGENILYGLGAIKGAGAAAIESIINARNTDGKFSSLFDLCKRVDGRKVNRRVLEAFIRAGAFDNVGTIKIERATLLASLDKALKMAEQHTRNATQGQVDLFAPSHQEQHARDDALENYIVVPPWTLAQRLEGEKATLGYYSSGHPLDVVIDDLRQLLPITLKELRAMPGRQQWLAGLITNIRMVKTRQGKQMQIVTLEDKTAKIDLVLFPDDVETFRELLVKDALLFAQGEVVNDDFNGGLRVRTKKLMNLAQLRAVCAKNIIITADMQKIGDDFATQLSNWIQAFVQKDGCPIEIHYHGNEASGILSLGATWRVCASDELILLLKTKLGTDKIKVEYQSL